MPHGHSGTTTCGLCAMTILPHLGGGGVGALDWGLPGLLLLASVCEQVLCMSPPEVSGSYAILASLFSAFLIISCPIFPCLPRAEVGREEATRRLGKEGSLGPAGLLQCRGEEHRLWHGTTQVQFCLILSTAAPHPLQSRRGTFPITSLDTYVLLCW